MDILIAVGLSLGHFFSEESPDSVDEVFAVSVRSEDMFEGVFIEMVEKGVPKMKARLCQLSQLELVNHFQSPYQRDRFFFFFDLL